MIGYLIDMDGVIYRGGRLIPGADRFFVYDPDGKPLPAGTGVQRSFATQEYEFYGQDVWKLRPNLTFHNGDKLTAEDVKFSFDRSVNS